VKDKGKTLMGERGEARAKAFSHTHLNATARGRKKGKFSNLAVKYSWRDRGGNNKHHQPPKLH